MCGRSVSLLQVVLHAGLLERQVCEPVAIPESESLFGFPGGNQEPASLESFRQ